MLFSGPDSTFRLGAKILGEKTRQKKTRDFLLDLLAPVAMAPQRREIRAWARKRGGFRNLVEVAEHQE